MKTQFGFVISILGLLFVSNVQAAPICDDSVAYYKMLDFAKYTVRSLGGTTLRVFPNLDLNLMMYRGVRADGKDIVGYLEFDRTGCQVSPKTAIAVDGEDILL
jgi:hypothetical protein